MATGPPNSMFSVLVGPNYISHRLFACHGELPRYGLPPKDEIPMEAFVVQRSLRAVPRADHVSPLERVTPSVWQATPRERAMKISEGGRDLACQALIFVNPDGGARLLDTTYNVAE